jgi:hypothetical protein
VHDGVGEVASDAEHVVIGRLIFGPGNVMNG